MEKADISIVKCNMIDAVIELKAMKYWCTRSEAGVGCREGFPKEVIFEMSFDLVLLLL